MMKKTKKRSKYGNKVTKTLDGQKFDSLKEKDRYYVLLMKQKAGIIVNLRRQVHFELLPAIYVDEEVQLKTKTKVVQRCLFRPTEYVADFVYEEDGQEVVEDVKASHWFQDPVYRLKKKMMYYFHNIKIKEIYD